MAPTSDQIPRSTVVALVGADSEHLLSGLSNVPALAALSLRESDPAEATRAVAVASRPDIPYIVHDADPLEHVAAAWVELYQERTTLGTLEIEVDTLLDYFARGAALMPDYYVVADPEGIEGTWRHWWLGVLAQRAPSRVLPIEATGAALRARLRALPTSRPWPDPEWLRHVQFDIPDRVGLRDQPGAA